MRISSLIHFFRFIGSFVVTDICFCILFRRVDCVTDYIFFSSY